MLKRLWLDEGGAVLSTELILLLVITVIGMVVGLTALRDAVDGQLGDLAGAIAAIDPAYAVSGICYDPACLPAMDFSNVNEQTYAWAGSFSWTGTDTDYGTAISGEGTNYGAHDVLSGILSSLGDKDSWDAEDPYAGL